MKSLKEYFGRVGKSRGFGIQSPWAYRFVTQIVGERLPYYAYKDIDREYSNKKERKFQKLMLRLRNFTYPAPVVIIDIVDINDSVLTDAISHCTSKGAIVIRGINSNKSARETWHNNIKERPDVGITFDMYDFAICFLNIEIYKQHYRLNF